MKSKHYDHPAIVRPGKAHNAAELYCIKCNKHIKWLSKKETAVYIEMTLTKKTQNQP